MSRGGCFGFFASVFVIATISSVSHAETGILNIRAGEHGSFSRLVVPFIYQDRTLVKAALDDQMLVVKFSAPVANIALDDINGKKKARRIRSARWEATENGAIALFDLNCTCNLTQTIGLNGALILDIADVVPAQTDDADATVGALNTIADPDQGGHITGDADGEESTPLDSDGQAADRNPEELDGSTKADRIAQAQRRLRALIGKAADAGAVNLKSSPGNEDKQGLDTSPRPTITAKIENPKLNSPPSLQQKFATPTVCPTAQTLAAISSTRENATYEEVLALQARLSGADGPDQIAKLVELASAYLALGLFEEGIASADEAMRLAPSTVTNERGDDMIAALFADAAFLKALAQFSLFSTNPAAVKGLLFESSFDSIDSCDPIVAALTKTANQLKTIEGFAPDSDIVNLRLIAAAIRGPLLTRLGVGALEADEDRAAEMYADAAREVYSDAAPAMLSYLEAALAADKDGGDGLAALEVFASTPGPTQTMAMADLLELAASAPSAPNDDLIDGVFEQPPRSDGSISSNRLTTTGADALAAAGRLADAIDILSRNAATRAGEKFGRQNTNQMAEIIASGLNADDRSIRAEAAITALEHIDLLRQHGHQATIDLAAEVASRFGMAALVRSIYKIEEPLLSENTVRIIAQADYNSGDMASAYATSMRYPHDPELALLGIRALRRTDGDTRPAGAIRRALERGISPSALAPEAFITRDWQLAYDVLSMLPAEKLTKFQAKQLALSALMIGLKTPPSAITRALVRPAAPAASDADALLHAFIQAPEFDPGNVSDMRSFTTGVDTEIQFYRQEISQ